MPPRSLTSYDTKRRSRLKSIELHSFQLAFKFRIYEFRDDENIKFIKNFCSLHEARIIRTLCTLKYLNVTSRAIRTLLRVLCGLLSYFLWFYTIYEVKLIILVMWIYFVQSNFDLEEYILIATLALWKNIENNNGKFRFLCQMTSHIKKTRYISMFFTVWSFTKMTLRTFPLYLAVHFCIRFNPSFPIWSPRFLGYSSLENIFVILFVERMIWLK